MTLRRTRAISEPLLICSLEVDDVLIDGSCSVLSLDLLIGCRDHLCQAFNFHAYTGTIKAAVGGCLCADGWFTTLVMLRMSMAEVFPPLLGMRIVA